MLLALGASLVVAVPWYLGLFYKVRFTQVQVPKAVFVYTKHVGPYHTVGKIFDKLSPFCVKLGAKMAMMSFDNPQEVEASQCSPSGLTWLAASWLLHDVLRCLWRFMSLVLSRILVWPVAAAWRLSKSHSGPGEPGPHSEFAADARRIGASGGFKSLGPSKLALEVVLKKPYPLKLRCIRPSSPCEVL